MRIQSHVKTNLKFYNFLAFLFLTIYLASDTISYKLVQFGPLLEPGPPFIFPITYAISNIIAEIYGISAAKRLIWLTLFFQLVYAMLIKFTIALPSPTTWNHQPEYNFVLGDILRFILSGTLATSLSTFLNIYIVSRWKVLLKGRHFWLRCVAASLIGGFVLVATIVIFGYSSHLADWKEALKLFLSIYTLEFAYSIALIIPTWLACGYLKEKEQLDVYEKKIYFNPFKFN